MSAFQAALPQFEALDVKVIGLSIDHKFAQKAFAEKLELTFPLLADPNRDVSQKLGMLLAEVAGIRQVNRRGVLVIDSEMNLVWQFGVDAATQPSVDEVLTQVRQMPAQRTA